MDLLVNLEFADEFYDMSCPPLFQEKIMADVFCFSHLSMVILV